MRRIGADSGWGQREADTQEGRPHCTHEHSKAGIGRALGTSAASVPSCAQSVPAHGSPEQQSRCARAEGIRAQWQAGPKEGQEGPPVATNLELLRSRQVVLEQQILEALDRVARPAHARHLLAIAVRDARVRHRVPVVPVCVHLENKRTLACAAALRRIGHRLPDGQHAHPVDLEARDVHAARVVVRVRGGARLGRAHAVLVVLAHEDNGKFPESRHIHPYASRRAAARAAAGRGAVSWRAAARGAACAALRRVQGESRREEGGAGARGQEAA